VKFRGGNGGAYKASAEILQIQGNWLYYILYAEVHLRVKLPSCLNFLPLTSSFSSGRTALGIHPTIDIVGTEQVKDHVRRTVENHSEWFSEMLILAEA